VALGDQQMVRSGAGVLAQAVQHGYGVVAEWLGRPEDYAAARSAVA
jgi:hypothetical protein